MGFQFQQLSRRQTEAGVTLEAEQTLLGVPVFGSGLTLSYADGQLQRVYWNVLDRAQDSPPQQQVVLPALDGLRLAFLDDNQQWLDSWPADDSARQRARLPRAVRLVLQHPRYGELERVLRLPDNPAQSPLGNPEEAP